MLFQVMNNYWNFYICINCICFVRKENKNNVFFQQFVSFLSLLVSVAAFGTLLFEHKQRRWRGETERRRIVEKSRYFYFLCVQKVFSSLHKIQVEPLTADGVFWRCFSFFSGPWQSYLYDGTVTSLPVFIYNILNCVPETNEAFMELERHAGKWIMTTFSFWSGVTFKLDEHEKSCWNK